MVSEIMENEQVIASIQQSLVAQKKNLSSLWQTLQNELEAINTRDGDKLESTAKEKLIILEEISKIDKKLSDFSLNKFKKILPNIDDDIKNINEQLTNCKQQNDINTHAAHQTQVAVKKLTEILLGSIKSITYDKKGLSQSGNLLGKSIKA